MELYTEIEFIGMFTASTLTPEVYDYVLADTPKMNDGNEVHLSTLLDNRLTVSLLCLSLAGSAEHILTACFPWLDA